MRRATGFHAAVQWSLVIVLLMLILVIVHRSTSAMAAGYTAAAVEGFRNPPPQLSADAVAPVSYTHLTLPTTPYV